MYNVCDIVYNIEFHHRTQFCIVSRTLVGGGVLPPAERQSVCFTAHGEMNILRKKKKTEQLLVENVTQIWSTYSSPLLPGSLPPIFVVPVRVLFIINRFRNYS